MSEYVFRTEEPIGYCYDCPINNQENGRCRLGVETSGCEIPKKCLLVELPTHGRLVDADKMFSILERSCCTDSLADTIAREILKGLIKNAPTVIEASKK